MKKEDAIVYSGLFVTEQTHNKRSLPGWNVAATKRMFRLVYAFKRNGIKCFMASPGIMPRIKGHGQRLKPIIERRNGVVAVSLGQLALPWIGYLLSPLSYVLFAIRLARRHKIRTVVQYCYYPGEIILSLWCKIFYGSRIILDCEDISVPSFKDWKKGSETRPVQQIWGYLLLKFSVLISSKVIILSRKFNDIIPTKKSIVISGCQKVDDLTLGESDEKAEICILYSGRVSKENGADIFADSIIRLDNMKTASPLHFLVCGSGLIEEMKKKLSGIKNIKVDFLGFLGNNEFDAMYNGVDVCLALQNPTGRHGRYKVPSKAYEAICSGKVLLAGDMGDFADIPDNVCLHLRPYTAEKLAEIFCSLSVEDVIPMRKAALDYGRQNFDVSVVREMLMDVG